MDPYVGKMLDNRYELLERIGIGGMAVVYKAKCHRLNRLVAIKILKNEFAQDADFRRRFNAESQAVAQLSHANIVSVYDVSRDGDIEYIVMELVDGITLKQYMSKRGQLNWRESLHFITQIMRGLSHAHSRGIVHRDIKPQNIMVLLDGSVKVTDFGIACLENSTQTLTQDALGSVHYISPEQARGDRTDIRSDIYSAGVVLYEMLTNKLPFEGDSPVSVAIQHLSSIPIAPREINPDIPEQLELICMKAMAPDLDRRYSSAEDMIADLEEFRKNPNVDLNFVMQDLRDEPSDDPTRPIRINRSDMTIVRQNHNSHTYDPYHSWDQRSPYNGYPANHNGYYPPDGNSRSGKRKTAVLAVIAVLLALALAGVAVQTMSRPFRLVSSVNESHEVPSLLGKTMQEAQADPRVQGVFLVDEIGREPSTIYDEDLILRQDPEAGEYRKGNNLIIKVIVSTGEEIGEMINVIGQSKTQAEVSLSSLIRKYALELNYLNDNSEEIPEGCIISTDPVQGGSLKHNQTVTLIVSKGPTLIPIPKFVGIQRDLVLEQLDSMDLQRGSVTVVDSDLPAGTVVKQNPEANTYAPAGTKVNLEVSRGPQKPEEEPEQPVPSDEPDEIQNIPDTSASSSANTDTDTDTDTNTDINTNTNANTSTDTNHTNSTGSTGEHTESNTTNGSQEPDHNTGNTTDNNNSNTSIDNTDANDMNPADTGDGNGNDIIADHNPPSDLVSSPGTETQTQPLPSEEEPEQHTEPDVPPEEELPAQNQIQSSQETPDASVSAFAAETGTITSVRTRAEAIAIAEMLPDMPGTDHLGSDTVSIALPRDEESGRLMVYQDNQLIYNQKIDCVQYDYNVDIIVRASGETDVRALFNGVQVYGQRIQIDGNYV